MAKTGPKPKPLADRFWPKVAKKSDDLCWEWQGAHDKHGYGQIGYGGLKRHVKAHRASWFLATGIWPTLHVLHHCDNPRCVNSKHLFLGTQADNHDDMKAKKRGNIGIRHGLAKVDDATVLKIRDFDGTLAEGAAEFHISGAEVSSIQRGKLWQHVGGRIRSNRQPGPRPR